MWLSVFVCVQTHFFVIEGYHVVPHSPIIDQKTVGHALKAVLKVKMKIKLKLCERPSCEVIVFADVTDRYVGVKAHTQ